ncbi:MAG: hypothetical protein AB1489_24755 [Acidobacteriota bacterium]
MQFKFFVLSGFILFCLIIALLEGARPTAIAQTAGKILPYGAKSEIIPPKKKGKLLTWLKAGIYKKRYIAEPQVHSSTGPHGGNVRTYYNPILTQNILDGKKVWQPGAAMVKELYFSGNEQVIGYSVMIKLDENSGTHGEGWLFYETFDGTNTNPFFGRGLPICANCHQAGVDYLLSPFRPQSIFNSQF